nr:hypothetical protein [Tanacetum cinerariifolium]
MEFCARKFKKLRRASEDLKEEPIEEEPPEETQEE